MTIKVFAFVAVASSGLSFAQPAHYPLGIGDQWTFSGLGPWYQLTISRDTLMPNGKSYSVFEGMSYFPTLQRYESNRLYCYNFSTGLDSLFLDFTWNSGDTIATIVGMNDTSDITFHKSTINILGHIRRAWSLGEGARHIPDAGWFITIADSIGIVELSTANATQRSSAVRIAGVVQVVTGVESSPRTGPIQFILYPAYPNPFNPQTTIDFSLSCAGEVTFTLLDSRGREIERQKLGLVAAGLHHLKLNGSRLSSGVYYYRLSHDAMIRTGHVMLLR